MRILLLRSSCGNLARSSPRNPPFRLLASMRHLVGGPKPVLDALLLGSLGTASTIAAPCTAATFGRSEQRASIAGWEGLTAGASLASPRSPRAQARSAYWW